jgi:hypothetical protein
MNFHALVSDFEARVRDVCSPYRRYRVLWLHGSPRTMKSHLARAVCNRTGWRYFDYTLDPGFLDALAGREEYYRPDDFLADLRRLVSDHNAHGNIFLDEIEPLLGWWKHEQKEEFFSLVGRAERLDSGVVVVTRVLAKEHLVKLLPGPEHLFEMPEGVEL